MPKINYITARGEYTCSKCGATIKKGDKYYKGTPFHRPPVIRCEKCNLYSYELSSSEYIQEIGRLQYKWKDDYAIEEDVWTTIRDDLETIKEGCEERYENIPDSLKDGSAGEILQDRIDSLEDVMTELDNLTMDEFICEGYDNLRQSEREIIDTLQGDDALEDAYFDIISNHNDNEAVKQLESNVNNAISERIDEIIGGIAS